VQAARRARADEDAVSRSPERLAGFHRAARSQLGAAGTSLLADKTEQLRTDWVHDRMVALGRGRARALGWPDAYAFTKSLGGERPARQPRRASGDLRRPSIVESSLSQPDQDGSAAFGWPSRSSSPMPEACSGSSRGSPKASWMSSCRFVVAALIAVAAKGPDPSGPTVFQVAQAPGILSTTASSSTWSRNWFTERPLYDNRGQPIVVPKWSFPVVVASRVSSEGRPRY